MRCILQIPFHLQCTEIIFLCMHHHVCLQVSTTSKCFSTIRALEIIFLGMNKHVYLQISTLSKCLPSFSTLKILFLCVDMDVSFQISPSSKYLPTFIALKIILLCMDKNVCPYGEMRGIKVVKVTFFFLLRFHHMISVVHI